MQQNFCVCNFVLMLVRQKILYIYTYIYICPKVTCNFILLLICKFLKQNKNLGIKKKKGNELSANFASNIRQI